MSKDESKATGRPWAGDVRQLHPNWKQLRRANEGMLAAMVRERHPQAAEAQRILEASILETQAIQAAVDAAHKATVNDNYWHRRVIDSNEEGGYDS